MLPLIRKLLLGVLGLAIAIGLLTTGFFIFLTIAVIGLVGWLYVFLWRKGIITHPQPRKRALTIGAAPKRWQWLAT